MMPPRDSIQSLQQAIGHGGDQVFDIVPLVLRDVLEDRLWTERRDRNGRPFRSFEAFATHILWQGLESSIDDLLLYCRKHPEVAELIRREVGAAAEHGGDRKSEAAKDQDSNATLIGRGSTYALARLKRDHPELAERVVAGKLSAHAAAIEAGFRRRVISLPDDDEAAASSIVRRWGPDRARRVADAIYAIAWRLS